MQASVSVFLVVSPSMLADALCVAGACSLVLPDPSLASWPSDMRSTTEISFLDLTCRFYLGSFIIIPWNLDRGERFAKYAL